MARPIKLGLDYFTIDTGIYTNKKVRLFRSEFESDDRIRALMVLVLLWARIYAGKGYYITWDEAEQRMFSEDIDQELEYVAKVVSAAVKWGLFSKDRYESKGVLTSEEITTRYLVSKGSRFLQKLNTELGVFPCGTPVVQRGTPVVQGTNPGTKLNKTIGNGNSSTNNGNGRRPDKICPICKKKYMGDCCLKLPCRLELEERERVADIEF